MRLAERIERIARIDPTIRYGLPGWICCLDGIVKVAEA